MMASVTVTDDAWRTPNFRQNMVTKIEEAILHCGAPTTKNAIEMESQVFSKAKSKDEYLGFVARLIIHIKEMGKNKMGGGPSQQSQGQGNPGQGQVQGQLQGQLMGGGQAQNTLLLSQMNSGGSMGGMNSMMSPQQTNYNVNTGGMQVNMNQAPGSMMQQGTPQLQQQLQQQQLQQQQPQMMNQNFMQQQALQQQQQQQQAMQQHQIQSSQLQAPQIQNQQMQNPQMQNPQMQNPQMQNPQMQNPQMQNPQMQNPQMQNSQMQNVQMQNVQMQNAQMQNAQMQGMMSAQGQPQPMMIPRGMQNAQMMGSRMMAPQPNMANQLTQMAQQQQRKTDGIGGMAQYGPGGGPIQRPMSQNQFMSPNVSQAGGMGPSPSPGSMGGASQGAPYGSSPGSAGMMHSPAGVGMNTLRPYPSQMVPSPGTSLNTPLMAAPTPSPRNPEDQACFEKIKELRKYTDLLQRMIAKIGNDDVEKSSRMKKLLEILTNPNQRVSMEVLLKCETALKRMERTDAGGPASVPQQTPGKEQTSPFTQFFDCVQNMSKYPSSGHTWRRTVEPAMQVFYGNALNPPVGEEDPPSDPEPETEGPQIPWVLTKELRLLNTARYSVKLRRQHEKAIILQLECSLVDQTLPTIPPLNLEIDPDYPDTRPQILGMAKDYGSTGFLSWVQKAFQARLYYMSHKFTVTELLGAWEMALRQVSNPNATQTPFTTTATLQLFHL